MKTGHIVAEVQLGAGPDTRHFGEGSADSYPTILTVGKDSFSSQVLLEDRSLVKPGAVINVHFRFLAPEAALGKMALGTEFGIWEQSNIGKGRVIEILGA